MAKITIGLATAHTPMVNAPPDDWPLFADKDRMIVEFLGEQLHDGDGNVHTYDEMLDSADPSVVDEITPHRLKARHDACQVAITSAATSLADHSVDAAIVIGDDHRDLFGDTNFPALAIYRADTMTNIMPEAIANLPSELTLGARGWYDEEPTEYPGHAALGQHLIEALTADGFDVASMNGLAEGQGMAHAITFVQKRLMGEQQIPVVPVFVNTFYPPNQPSMQRCCDLGRAIKNAIDAWTGGERVAVIASGGLSHFVVHEDFDLRVLDALANRDFEALINLPDTKLKSGNSEVKNWVVAAAAVDHLTFELIDYVPCYRSLAGTGAGLAFARWV